MKTKTVYLDNAATTPIHKRVIAAMSESLANDFGNASSSHSFGRNAKNSIEIARKNIAKHLNAAASEIIFTSGATEGNNWILNAAIQDLHVQRIITAKTEHHAVLHAAQHISKKFNIRIEYLNVDVNGQIKVADLVNLLHENVPTLVSLMHVNNETGVVFDIETIARICKQYNAFFHSDTVQSIGKYQYDLQKLPLDFLVASAHKFHGPKGIGFVFFRKGLAINPIIVGGEQEKGLRAGTEAVHNIVGMSTALTICSEDFDQNITKITSLKKYCLEQLKIIFPTLKCNGSEDTFFNILNVQLPISDDKTALLLFNLDMKGIAVSRGSACQSGSSKPSHVLAEMLNNDDLKKPSIRISFSTLNTFEDIDYLVNALKSI